MKQLLNTLAAGAFAAMVSGITWLAYETVALRTQLDDLESRVTRDETTCRANALLVLAKFEAVEERASVTAANVARLEGAHDHRGDD